MELPSLEEWSYSVDLRPIPLDSFLSLLERSSFRLNVVKFSDLRSEQVYDFRILLEEIPSLKHQSLSHVFHPVESC